ncbi:MAG: DNA polymerase III subunit beta [Firmicutes bacterium]|nr:DNA polymerase III subunit beta [Bacillota bacterium]
MHCTVAQDHAAQALRHLIRVISPQLALPLLGGVQLDATDHVLRLTATDLTHHVVAEIPATVDEPGLVVVPAVLLHDLVQRVPTATVTLATVPASGRVMVRAGRHQTQLNPLGPEPLPDFPALTDSRATVTLPAGTLPSLSRQLLFACSRNEYRPILQGVQWTGHGDQVQCVSTDGSRLSQVTWPLPADAVCDQTVVIPAKTLQEAVRLNTREPVTLTITDALVQCAAPGIIFTSRLLSSRERQDDRSEDPTGAFGDAFRMRKTPQPNRRRDRSWIAQAHGSPVIVFETLSRTSHPR